jgi:2-amino-4-hydroxy-6-hydroxymethyldihydropteridine diphosphokinase
MSKGYLGLGSNMGDKKKYIDNALELLREHKSIEVLEISSYYETDPIGYTDQDLFLNIVVKIYTLLQPLELLSYCHEIEEKLNRERIIRWGPRTIDVDILLYENYSSQDEKLIIPHPRMTERAFVMIPLYEIEKNISINGIDIKNIVEALQEEGIRKVTYDR